MDFYVIIPARFGSSRLPGKVLADIGGKPMVVHVYERALASGAEQVVVATDDPRVDAVLKDWGIEVKLTDLRHRSGSERSAEVVKELGLLPESIVVNVQADEPLTPPRLIYQVAYDLHTHPNCDVATLCEPIEEEETLLDPNAVKVVIGEGGRALYFSRAPIPWYRDEFSYDDHRVQSLHFRHMGIYAYRAGYLLDYASMPICELELAESLEQLRILYHGGLMHVAIAEVPPGPGVDTQRDLARVRALVDASKG